ncbi:class I SAM-dependent methyltransferase [uncultured Litoreibacter sp.]|uniref:class I SAM-dependent DNA methyltransferase n=1 Tax=uncultured Litoreibacter sp. TaxID=1392394 RepID=UPI002612E674|nr:class I SAM-dependent methyltransferase [uncultured Litoreibacter sp.]
MSDAETVSIYNTRADSYNELVSSDTPDQDLQAFLDAVAPGGHVMDLGCGPGNSAAMMRDAGLSVDAVDASSGMVRVAREKYGIDVRLATFDDITGTDLYDGVWANFSLLHATKADMPRHLAAIKAALKPGGVFHIGTKLGSDEMRDSIGRMYSYYEADELLGLLKDAGFASRAPRFGRDKGLSGEMADFIVVLSDA